MRPIATILAALALAFASVARADYYVVVSEQNPVTALSQIEVLQLFTGRLHFFPDGRPALPCDISSESLREGFYRSLSGMSLAQVNSYWARLMFSGRRLPPQRLASQAAMVQRVGSDPAAIGWLMEEPKQKGLRTVLIIRSSP